MNSSVSSSSSASLPKHFMVPLDFNNVSKLPESHEWTTTLPTANLDHHPFIEEPLPIIDFAKPDVLNLIKHACEEWGAFQVINHSIPICLLNEMEYQTRRLFSLSKERKLLVGRSPDGLTGYGLARISPFFPKLLWSEGFTIRGSTLVEHASQLWPQDHSNFCKVIEQYQEEMKGLSEKIVALMFSSLGLTHEEDKKWFEPANGYDPDQTQASCVLHLNSYPICPDPSRAMGLAPHTDSSLLTIVYQANISGLQVHRDVGWVFVEPVEDALIVNVGDLMQIISNGMFKSVLHRVVVNNKKHRVSMAYFYGPPREAKVAPLKKLIDDNSHPPLYRTVTWKEYLIAKSKNFSNALDSILL